VTIADFNVDNAWVEEGDGTTTMEHLRNIERSSHLAEARDDTLTDATCIDHPEIQVPFFQNVLSSPQKQISVRSSVFKFEDEADETRDEGRANITSANVKTSAVRINRPMRPR
jgi:hypothetical protein